MCDWAHLHIIHEREGANLQSNNSHRWVIYIQAVFIQRMDVEALLHTDVRIGAQEWKRILVTYGIRTELNNCQNLECDQQLPVQ